MFTLPSAPLSVGPAGWSYPHWDGLFYPRPRPRNLHPLTHLARFFNTVEINSTYHQPLRPEVAQLWLGAVTNNEDFLFTAKLARKFTHDFALDRASISQFSEGLKPLLRANRLGALLMQFPWSFRFSEENRERFLGLRRAFHEFPLVAEFRHSSWSYAEALGTLIDYRVGFCNLDQPEQPKAMPPSSCLTTSLGYVRLSRPGHLYSQAELDAWVQRIRRITPHARRVFVVFNNDGQGQSLVNALQLRAELGHSVPPVPRDLLLRYPAELEHFHAAKPVQRSLFATTLRPDLERVQKVA